MHTTLITCLLVTTVVAAAQALPLSLGCSDLCDYLIESDSSKNLLEDCDCLSDEDSDSRSVEFDDTRVFYEPSETYPVQRTSLIQTPLIVVRPKLEINFRNPISNILTKRKVFPKNKELKVNQELFLRDGRDKDFGRNSHTDSNEQSIYIDIDLQVSKKNDTDVDKIIDELLVSEETFTDCINAHLLIYAKNNSFTDNPERWLNFTVIENITNSQLVKIVKNKCQEPDNAIRKSLEEIKNAWLKVKTQSHNAQPKIDPDLLQNKNENIYPQLNDLNDQKNNIKYETITENANTELPVNGNQILKEVEEKIHIKGADIASEKNNETDTKLTTGSIALTQILGPTNKNIELSSNNTLIDKLLSPEETSYTYLDESNEYYTSTVTPLKSTNEIEVDELQRLGEVEKELTSLDFNNLKKTNLANTSDETTIWKKIEETVDTRNSTHSLQSSIDENILVITNTSTETTLQKGDSSTRRDDETLNDHLTTIPSMIKEQSMLHSSEQATDGIMSTDDIFGPTLMREESETTEKNIFLKNNNRTLKAKTVFNKTGQKSNFETKHGQDDENLILVTEKNVIDMDRTTSKESTKVSSSTLQRDSDESNNKSAVDPETVTVYENSDITNFKNSIAFDRNSYHDYVSRSSNIPLIQVDEKSTKEKHNTIQNEFASEEVITEESHLPYMDGNGLLQHLEYSSNDSQESEVTLESFNKATEERGLDFVETSTENITNRHDVVTVIPVITDWVLNNSPNNLVNTFSEDSTTSPHIKNKNLQFNHPKDFENIKTVDVKIYDHKNSTTVYVSSKETNDYNISNNVNSIVHKSSQHTEFATDALHVRENMSRSGYTNNTKYSSRKPHFVHRGRLNFNINSPKKNPVNQRTSYKEDSARDKTTTDKKHVTATKLSKDAKDSSRLITFSEKDIKIPKVITREFQNDTVVSEIEGTEVIQNNDFNDSSISKNMSMLAFNNELSTKGKNDFVHGKLYFIFNKSRVPMNFIQKDDGEISLGIDGPTICAELNPEESKSVLIDLICNCVGNNYCPISTNQPQKITKL